MKTYAVFRQYVSILLDLTIVSASMDIVEMEAIVLVSIISLKLATCNG